jgi:hypothetical protein
VQIQKCLFSTLLTLLLIATRTYSAPIGIIVPAYFHPSASAYWNELDFAAKRVPLIVIINPNSGPGASKDKNYVQVLSKLHQAGSKIVGYVHTSYGARSLAGVENEINLYLSFYRMDGFFIDEMTDDENSKHIDYYAAIYKYIKAKSPNYTVTGNPGSNTQEHYLTRPADDCCMIFEDNGTNYAGFNPSGWVVQYPAERFAHLPYGVKTTIEMSHDVGLAMSRNAGWIYVTDDALPNPYNAMPSYWTNEVELVQSFNNSSLLISKTNLIQVNSQALNIGSSINDGAKASVSKNE